MGRSDRRSVPWLFVALVGCGGGVAQAPLDFGAGPEELEGFASCSGEQPERVRVSPDEPLTVIVHGCYASGAQFREMSRLFEFNGQRAVCFNYDDRHSLRHVGRTLRRGLDAIRARAPEQTITVLGHSQGGLVSRIALAEVDGSPDERANVRLITVSAPFSGIAAAEHCGWVWLHVLSLGITPGVCQAIAGHKWTEITPSARLWNEPRALQPLVASHLTVVTDERDTCRRHGEDGGCEEDDFVFAVREQANRRMARDPRVRSRVLPAGHGAVTGADGTVPRELVQLLQAEGVLAEPPPERRVAFEELLQAIF